MRKALRQAQGERIWEGRVRWGVGDAMGDGDAPRRVPLDSCLRRNDARGGVRDGREVGTSPRLAPALGSRESGNDDGGCGGMRWREGLVSGWGPALAGGRFSNRPYDRGGAHEGGGDAGAAGGGRPPSSALRTGFDRLRANGFGRGACGGVWGMRWGAETPRAAPLPWVPVFTGTTMGGVRAGKRWWWWRAPFVCPQDRLRQAQGERTREAPLRRGVGGVGVPMGGGCGAPPRFWVLACAGSRVGGDGGTAR